MYVKHMSNRLQYTLNACILLCGMFYFFVSIRFFLADIYNSVHCQWKIYTLGIFWQELSFTMYYITFAFEAKSFVVSRRYYIRELDLFLLFDESQQPERAHAGVQCETHDSAHPFKPVIGRTK